jgi:hypothetical protein
MTDKPVVPHQSERAETPHGYLDRVFIGLLREFPEFQSLDGSRWYKTGARDKLTNSAADELDRLASELAAERAANEEAQRALTEMGLDTLHKLRSAEAALKEAQRELQQVHQASASSVASSPDVGTDAAAHAQDEVVGHKTFSDGHGGFRHEPLKRTEAEAIMALCDAQQAARTARYPTAEDAVRSMCDAHHRLRELGWREAIYAPPDGKLKRVVEAGSSGIHEAYCERRPEGSKGPNWWWSPSEGDLWPVTPILYFPDELPRTVRATVALMSEDYAQKTGFGQDKPSSPPLLASNPNAVQDTQGNAGSSGGDS